jgi:hypothetical protein
MKNVGTPVVTPITPIGHESLTFLSGLVYGVRIPKTIVPPTLGGTELKTYFALSRSVDWLSSQFAAALASGMRFSVVTIQTPSGHVVTLQNVVVAEITKAGRRNGLYAGDPLVGPGMEAISWAGNWPIQVDGSARYFMYDWLGLNS